MGFTLESLSFFITRAEFDDLHARMMAVAPGSVWVARRFAGPVPPIATTLEGLLVIDPQPPPIARSSLFGEAVLWNAARCYPLVHRSSADESFRLLDDADGVECDFWTRADGAVVQGRAELAGASRAPTGEIELASPFVAEAYAAVKSWIKARGRYVARYRDYYTPTALALLAAEPEPMSWVMEVLSKKPATKRPEKAAPRTDYEESFRRAAQQLGVEGSPQPDRTARPTAADDPAGPHLFRAGVHDVTLPGLTLPGLFIDSCELGAVSLRGSDFRHSTFIWSDFNEVDLSACDLSGSDLRSCTFRGCSFWRANLSGCDLRHSSFEDCRLTGARFTHAVALHSQRSSLPLSAAQARSVQWTEVDDPPPGG